MTVFRNERRLKLLLYWKSKVITFHTKNNCRDSGMCINHWNFRNCRKTTHYTLPRGALMVEVWIDYVLMHFKMFTWKKNRLEVYCSVSLLFSRCIDHFICYSCIFYIGDSLGHVICFLIYFRLAAMLWTFWSALVRNLFILLPQITWPKLSPI
jgi:hypothetical protein